MAVLLVVVCTDLYIRRSGALGLFAHEKERCGPARTNAPFHLARFCAGKCDVVP